MTETQQSDCHKALADYYQANADYYAALASYHMVKAVYPLCDLPLPEKPASCASPKIVVPHLQENYRQVDNL